MSAIDLFLADETSLYKRAVEKIAADPLIFAGLKKWNVYDAKEKIDFIERYARLLAQELTPGLSPDIEFFQQPRAGFQLEKGHFSPRQGFTGNGTIRINTHPDVLPTTTLESQLDLIAHEMTHKRQHDIIKIPTLAGEKHKFTIPALFNKNFNQYHDGKDYDAYFEQFIEAHAFAMGELAASTMLAFAKKRSWIPNPYRESGRQLEFQMNSSASPSHVSVSQRNGIISSDPHEHYWAGRSTEAKLAQPWGRNSTEWFTLVKNYTMAVKCGEFVSFNHEPALEGLYNIAQGNVFVERPGKEDCHLKTPPDIQKQAREALEKFTQSPTDRVRIGAKRFVALLEAHEKQAQKPSPGRPTPRGI